MMKRGKEKARIGDVIEIQTLKGLAYAQFTHDTKYGELIRVLPGLFETRPESFTDLVQSRERYFTYYPLAAVVFQKLVQIVAHEPIPFRAQKFPLMRMRGTIDRSGRVLDWWLYDGEREWRVGDLTPELRSLSIAQTCTHPRLVEDIVQGWSPEWVGEVTDRRSDEGLSEDGASSEENSERYSSHPGDQAVLDQLEAVGSNLAAPHPVRHYLYFQSKRAAQKAAEALQEQGYSAQAELSGDGSCWLTLAKHDLIPTEIDRVREQLEELAESLGGNYDGWEAGVTK